MNMHRDMFNDFKSISMWMKMTFMKMSMWMRVKRLHNGGNCVMGITVLIVTAVSTSYKREAWKVKSTRLVFLGSAFDCIGAIDRSLKVCCAI